MPAGIAAVPQALGWWLAALVALGAAFVVTALEMRVQRYRRSLDVARERLDVLQRLAPPLGEAAPAVEVTCARLARALRRLTALDLALCFRAADDGSTGRLILAGKDPEGESYAAFLRVGDAHERDSIVAHCLRTRRATVVGPLAARIDAELGIDDVGSDPALRGAIGPVAGRRERAWAIALPLVHHGAVSSVLGVLYGERPAARPFEDADLACAQTIAHLGAEALHRSLHAERLQRAADTDALTGLLTPSAFRARLRDEVGARRFARPPLIDSGIGVLFIDTDRFKECNDTFGHAAGDVLLAELARMYRGAADGVGFAGRNGGDEFCIAFLDRSKDACVARARELRERVAGTDFLSLVRPGSSRPGLVTISVGVAHFPADVEGSGHRVVERLLELADQNMYAAKRAGRDRVVHSAGLVAARPPQKTVT